MRRDLMEGVICPLPCSHVQYHHPLRCVGRRIRGIESGALHSSWFWLWVSRRLTISSLVGRLRVQQLRRQFSQVKLALLEVSNFIRSI
jgi:hypothetical protein